MQYINLRNSHIKQIRKHIFTSQTTNTSLFWQFSNCLTTSNFCFSQRLKSLLYVVVKDFNSWSLTWTYKLLHLSL